VNSGQHKSNGRQEAVEILAAGSSEHPTLDESIKEHPDPADSLDEFKSAVHFSHELFSLMMFPLTALIGLESADVLAPNYALKLEGLGLRCHDE